MNAIENKSWDEVKMSLDKKPALQNALAAVVSRAAKQPKRANNVRFPVLEYTYGELVVDQGHFRLPKSLGAASESEAVLNDLGLAQAGSATRTTPSVPIGLVLQDEHKGNKNGILEASFRIERNVKSGSDWEYHSYPTRETLPQAILCPGTLFGLFEYFDFHIQQGAPPPYDVSAGCRSPFIVSNFELDSETFMQRCPDQRRQDSRSGLD